MDTGNDKELERLKDAMEQARALYDSAKLEFERARALSEELGAAHPDGSLRHAIRVQNRALSVYRNALMEFNRFVLDGISPVRVDSPHAPPAQSGSLGSYFLAGAGNATGRVDPESVDGSQPGEAGDQDQRPDLDEQSRKRRP